MQSEATAYVSERTIGRVSRHQEKKEISNHRGEIVAVSYYNATIEIEVIHTSRADAVEGMHIMKVGEEFEFQGSIVVITEVSTNLPPYGFPTTTVRGLLCDNFTEVEQRREGLLVAEAQRQRQREEREAEIARIEHERQLEATRVKTRFVRVNQLRRKRLDR
jgi:hypothetical protein